MTKTMMMALAALLSVSLMGCGGGNEEPSAAPESTVQANEDTTVEPEADAPEAEAAPAAEQAAADVPAHYEEWIPSFATNVYTQEEAGTVGVGYESSESLENTKKFYQDKIAAAGYTEVLNQDQESGWMYSGMMDDSTGLTVLVVEAQGKVVGSVAIVDAASAANAS